MSLNHGFPDGRINSSKNEEELLEKIKKHFNIRIPKSRDWYDFSINESDIFYPVNIKITKTGLGADNLNCKLG